MIDLVHKIHIVYIVSDSSDLLPNSFLLDVYPSQRPRISGLIVEETLIKVSAKYSDFADVFFLDLASKLPKYTGINNHANELVEGQ